MSIPSTREQRRQLERDNAKLPRALQLVERKDWPATMISADDLIAVWRSRNFLVQKFTAPPPAICRLSINRTTLSGDRWAENITWNELQALKNELGFFAHTAVEIFPPIQDVVDVASIRHLWVLDGPLPYAWTSRRAVRHGGATA